MQSGQSSGQHDEVHGFPEPVNSFITFVIPSQIPCGKVKTPSYFSAQDCVKVSPGFVVVFKNGKFSAIGFTLQLFEVICETAANPGETFTQPCAVNMSVLFALYHMKSELV